MGRIFLPANFCDYFLISPTTGSWRKKAVFATASKVRRQKSTGLWRFTKYLAYEVLWTNNNISLAEEKKDLDCILSCADPAARTLLERGRREGGKEGGREKPSYKFATVIQIQTLDKHIHPIMLRLFVTIRTFFLLFIQQLEKHHQFKFNLRVSFLF